MMTGRLHILILSLALSLPIAASAQSPVDLGLSVRWADRNVGASSPEGYGDHFAFGETEPKDIYTWKTYKLSEGTFDSLTKYCTREAYGTVDGLTVLEPSDDAATVNCGREWRTPTKEEWNELVRECDWTWVSDGGGYMVRSRRNGNSIFLPAGGFRVESDHHYFTCDGLYWSSTVCEEVPYDAYRLYFGSDYIYVRYYGRFFGRNVRAVYDAPSAKE